MKSNTFHSLLSASAVVLALGFAASPAGATIVYNSWTSNEAPNGNYTLTVTDVGSFFNYSLTVNPWNAEALGLFIDLGAASISTPVSVTNVVTAPTTTGTVIVFATDTTSDACGQGCNLQGLALPALVGGDWELVFSLGTQGYEGIQTFSWTTSDFGLTESAFGVVGIRAQQLCETTGTTLPTGTCDGSDKVYGFGTIQNGGGGPSGVPEPGVLFLMGAGLLGLGLARRRKPA